MAVSKSSLRVAERNPATSPAKPAATATGAGPAAAAPAIAADMMRELKVSGHLMALPAGLYCILQEPAVASQAGLPAIRISLPPTGGAGVEITSFRPDSWLSTTGDAALVRVATGPAQILVTIYQLPNAPEAAPKLQVRQLVGGVETPRVATPAPAPAPVAPARPVAGEKMNLMAHVQSSGDRGAKFGGWVGERGSGNWIEGFAIAPPEGFAPADLSYQAVLGRGWLSPWVEAGQYCGSRGMALPLLGFRIKITGALAAAFELSASASFVDGSACGPVGSDTTCEAAKLSPLEAMTVGLAPRVRKAAKGKR